MPSRLVILFFLFAAASIFQAEASTLVPTDKTFQFRSRVWQIESGLPQNVVQAIAQTPEGFLWVGTQQGLARFDGHQFELSDFAELRSEKINALTVSPDKSLWVGTATRGLYQIQNGKLTHHSLEGIADPRILSLRSDPDGSVWIGTLTGVAHFDGQQIRALPGKEFKTADAVRAIARNTNGIHWFASVNQLIALSNSISIHNFSEANGIPNRYLRALLVDDEGVLWIGSNAGLSCFRDGKFSHYSKTDGLPDDTVSALFQDSTGRLWAGTFNGLCRKVGERFVPVASEDGEPFDQVFAFIEDHEKNLWVGTKSGLVRLNQNRFKTLMTRDGLRHDNVISVLGDNSGLWIGTWGGGLHFFDEGKVSVWSKETHPELRNDLILALHKTRDGALWFGTDYDGGVYRIKDGALTRLAMPEKMQSQAVRDIYEDRAGTVWIATSFGVLRYQNEKLVRLGTRDLPHPIVRCIAEDSIGRLWFGTEKGLARWDNGKFDAKRGLSDKMVLSLRADKISLWIGTTRGLLRMKGGKITSFASQHPLLANPIAEIIEDDFKNLWLSCDRGILRVKKSDLLSNVENTKAKIEIELFGKEHGMISSVCVGTAKPSAWKAQDGQLWFATTRGIVATNPRRTAGKNTLPPPVFITRILADKKSVADASLSPAPLQLAPGLVALQFDYTALSYREPENNRFKFKLDGFDKEWIDVGERRSAFYNNLKPGSYRFHVIACNNDGVWNESGAQFAFVLQPYFWQTIWFRGAVAFSLAMLAVVGTRHITKKRMQAHLKKLEQEHALEKERTRIAQDMHDDLGARITEILLVGKATLQNGNDSKKTKSNVRRICDAAQEIATDLNAIVFAVNPKNDSLEQFVAYICKYVEKYLSASSVRCRIDMPVHVPDLPVSSEVRHHVVMSIKEALNNALKHSEATEISVEAKIDGAIFSIWINDNGKGFKESEANSLATVCPGCEHA